MSLFQALETTAFSECERLCSFGGDARSTRARKCRCRGAGGRCQDCLEDRGGEAGSGSPWNTANFGQAFQAWCFCRECGSSSGCAPADSKCLPWRHKMLEILIKARRVQPSGTSSIKSTQARSEKAMPVVSALSSN